MKKGSETFHSILLNRFRWMSLSIGSTNDWRYSYNRIDCLLRDAILSKVSMNLILQFACLLCTTSHAVYYLECWIIAWLVSVQVYSCFISHQTTHPMIYYRRRHHSSNYHRILAKEDDSLYYLRYFLLSLNVALESWTWTSGGNLACWYLLEGVFRISSFPGSSCRMRGLHLQSFQVSWKHQSQKTHRSFALGSIDWSRLGLKLVSVVSGFVPLKSGCDLDRRWVQVNLRLEKG